MRLSSIGWILEITWKRVGRLTVGPYYSSYASWQRYVGAMSSQTGRDQQGDASEKLACVVVCKIVSSMILRKTELQGIRVVFGSSIG